MDIGAIASAVVEIGVIPALLIILVILNFKRDKHQSEKYAEIAKNQDERYNELKTHFKDRLDNLLAEGVRREDIMRSEAAKREQIMREESARRDEMFVRSMDNLNSTIDKTNDCMDDMKKALFKMDFQLQNIEGKVAGRVGG